MLRVGGGRKKFEVEKNAAPFAAQKVYYTSTKKR